MNEGKVPYLIDPDGHETGSEAEELTGLNAELGELIERLTKKGKGKSISPGGYNNLVIRLPAGSQVEMPGGFFSELVFMDNVARLFGDLSEVSNNRWIVSVNLLYLVRDILGLAGLEDLEHLAQIFGSVLAAQVWDREA